MATLTREDLGYPIIDLPDAAVSSCESVIRFMVDQLVALGRISQDHAARAACQVVTREHQGSTALGNGVAMPHSKSEVPSVIGLIGRSRLPLPWHGADGVSVREVCLLLTPVNDPREAFAALEDTVAALSGKAKDPTEPGGTT